MGTQNLHDILPSISKLSDYTDIPAQFSSNVLCMYPARTEDDIILHLPFTLVHKFNNICLTLISYLLAVKDVY